MWRRMTEFLQFATVMHCLSVTEQLPMGILLFFAQHLLHTRGLGRWSALLTLFVASIFVLAFSEASSSWAKGFGSEVRASYSFIFRLKVFATADGCTGALFL